MDLKEFHKSIEDIVLFPGSLYELNILEKVNGSGKTYELIQQKDGEKYLTGPIIPKPSELKEMIRVMQGVGGILDKSDLGLELGLDDLGFELDKYKMDEMAGMLEEIMITLYETPELMETDIRLKAKKIGANGLVDVRLYHKDGIYMGVPVKLKK
ncbi:MAG: hypothetical protein J7J93_01965 [Candidatus Aenigmarchaeota archaeon]|nr:hypothetical protein [Candidatus Aenigmarchaeota archaeon]